MKIGRCRTTDSRTVCFSSTDEKRYFEYDPLVGKAGNEIFPARLLAPVLPSKIVAAGLNYRDHARELSLEIPEEPLIFLKPSSAIIGPEDAIIYPNLSKRVDYEAELAVVISRDCRNVSPENASKYIFGFTCLNDVTARDLQMKDGQWTRAKSFDTFCPIGPWIETAISNPGSLDISCTLNGKIMQKSNTSNLIFPVEELISRISSVMTLNRWDIIATGTPAGIGPVNRGDIVRIEIEGVGILQNSIA